MLFVVSGVMLAVNGAFMSLVELSTRFVTIDFAARRIRSYSVWRERRDAGWKRRVHVARANHVYDANVVETGEHRDVARQLALNLDSCGKHRRVLNVRILRPNDLLRQRNAAEIRDCGRTKLI